MFARERKDRLHGVAAARAATIVGDTRWIHRAVVVPSARPFLAIDAFVRIRRDSDAPGHHRGPLPRRIDRSCRR